MEKQTQTSSGNGLLLTPEQIAEIIRSAQLTAEQINELKKPYVDHEAETRKLATRRQMQRDQWEMVEAQRETQENCPHQKRDINGIIKNKIELVHNFPDSMPRGICLLCRKVWHPARWEFQGMNRDRVQLPATPGYDKILELERFSTEIA